MDLNTSFTSAQTDFYDWVTKWAKEGKNSEINRTPDVIDFITIFQILGFSICHADAHNPLEVSTLSSGERGLKINISCSHSGVRFVLEGVNICSCPEKMVDDLRLNTVEPNRVKNKESLENIRLLNVPEGEKEVIRTVLIHLVHLMHLAAKNNDQNQNSVEIVNEDNKQNQNLEGGIPMKINKSPEDFLTPGVSLKNKEIEEKQKSPVHYRSLDALIGKTSLSEFSQPGKLIKAEETSEKNVLPVITYSSPNLSILQKPYANTSSPVANMSILKQGYSKLLSIQELVKDVIDTFEKSQELPKFVCDVSNIKSSTESFCLKQQSNANSNSDPNLVKKFKPTSRPSIRSVSSVGNLKIVSNSLNKPTTSRRSSDNKSPTPSKTKNQKYAHVKSTIPKGSVSKK